jgi:hypothetical protein
LNYSTEKNDFKLLIENTNSIPIKILNDFPVDDNENNEMLIKNIQKEDEISNDLNSMQLD